MSHTQGMRGSLGTLTSYRLFLFPIRFNISFLSLISGLSKAVRAAVLCEHTGPYSFLAIWPARDCDLSGFFFFFEAVRKSILCPVPMQPARPFASAAALRAAPGTWFPFHLKRPQLCFQSPDSQKGRGCLCSYGEAGRPEIQGRGTHVLQSQDEQKNNNYKTAQGFAVLMLTHQCQSQTPV